MSSLHTINCFALQYRHAINKTLFILFAGVMLAISSYGGYFAATQFTAEISTGGTG